jgi:hypothetical protein
MDAWQEINSAEQRNTFATGVGYINPTLRLPHFDDSVGFLLLNGSGERMALLG